MKKIFLILFILFAFTNGFSQSTNCSTASNLSLNNGTACVNGSNAGAITDNILYGSCNASPVNVVWYTYVANGPNNTFTVTPGTLQNAEIIIYLGGCPNTGTLQICQTATASNSMVTIWGMTTGQQAWIGIASTTLQDGTFQLCISSQPPVPGVGNTCAQAIPICTSPFSKPTMVANASGQLPNCFANPPQQDTWVKFTITQAGSLRWTATPTNLATEFDWCLWDITAGCPGAVACCNYNFAAGSTQGFGMQNQAGNVACGNNLATGLKPAEFCPALNVICGRVYAIQISNYDNNNSGFNLTFINSTAMISSSVSFVVTPTLVCGASLNAAIVNNSTGACNGETWTFGDGSPTYNGLTPPNHNYTTPGTYAITATIPGLCPSVGTQFVQLLAPLAATVNSTPVLCPGSCLGSATVNPVTGGDGIYTYQWSNGSTTPNVSALCPGVYTYSVYNAKCNSTVTNTINITAPPALTLNAVPANATCGASNGSVSVGASGGTPSYSFNINGGPFAAVTNFTGLAAGTHTIGVRDINNCQITVTIAITSPPAPVITVNSATVCSGMQAVLTATGGTTYSWSPAAGLSSTTGAAVTATTVGSATYIVVGTVGACSGTAAAVVNIMTSAPPVPANTGPYCEGATIQLNVGASSTYTWSGPNSFSNNTQNPTIATSSLSSAGVYTVAVTDVNGCINAATTNVVVNPLPQPIAGSNSPICLNNPINLTATGGTTYQWDGPNAYTSGVQNPTIANAQLNMSGVYSVTVTSAQGCTNTAVTTVSVYALPSPTITSNSPVCNGGQLTLSGTGGATYQWNGPNSFSNPNQNATINPVTMAANGTYTLIASVGTCTAIATAVMVINPLPVPNIVSNSPVCIGQDISLSATGGTAFAWAGPNTFASANQTETITASVMANAGTYTLTVTDANGCINSTTGNVIVNPQPVVVATGTSVCENANAQLTSNGGVTYSWSGPGGYASGLQNPVIFNAQLASTGQYTVLVTNANTCTNTAVVSVTINPAITPTIVTNSPLCINDILNLSGVGGATYNWTGPNGFMSSIQNPTVLASSFAVSGTYQVNTIDMNGCPGSTTASVVVNPNPVPQITSGPNVGCAPLCVTFTIQSTPTASLAYWTFGNGESVNGALNTVSCYKTAGTYTINSVVSDINGCLGSATWTVTVWPKPVADFNHAPIKPIINIDADVIFTDASWGAPIVSWNWYFMNTAQYTSVLQNPVFAYTEPGAYVVALIVKSDKGCLDTLLRPLVVGEDYGLYVPNAFTPNNDGFNDVFQPKGFGIVKYELNIFDRWGEKVYSTKEFTESWNGTFQGRGNKLCEESVYTWLITVTDVFGKAHELKGHVTLMK